MKNFVLVAIKVYQRIISPFVVSIFGPGCRFNPTCSEYSRQVIERYGLKRGGTLALKRVLQCHPFAKGMLNQSVK